MKINFYDYLRQNNAFLRAESNGVSSFLKVKENADSPPKPSSLKSSNNNFSSPIKKAELSNLTAITFKGNVNKASNSLFSGLKKFFAKHFMEKGVVVSDFSKLTSDTNALLGDGFLKSRIDEFNLRMGEDASRFMQIDGNKLTVYDKKVSGKLLSGLSDVAWLPLDILGAGLKGIAKIPGIKGSKVDSAINNIPFIRHRSNQKAAMDLYYKIKGAASYADNPLKIRQEVLRVPQGKSVGNYNTKDERGLNRLATGAVSSFFVGMDFHNLVMYEKNNKDEADKAGKKRRNRELMRISINAFMTYSVLGALSSYVNRSKALACAAIAGSALFAEVITRLIVGTPLVPLTPEGAKKYNAKRLEKERQKTNNEIKLPFFKSKKEEPAAVAKDPAKTSSIQQSQFSAAMAPASKGADNIFNAFTNPYKTLNKKDSAAPLFKGGNEKSDKTGENKKKSPITLNRLALAAIVAMAANILYGMARSKVPKFNSFMSGIENKIANFYNKHSKKDLIVESEELRKLLEGFEGNKTDAIRDAYARVLDVTFTKEEAQGLKKAVRDGYVRVEKDDEIFSKAFERSSDTVLKEYTDMLSSNSPKADFTKVTDMVTDEIIDTSNLKLVNDHLTSAQKFESIEFEIDYDNPVIINGVEYFRMKNAEYNFGRIKDTKLKILLDAVSYPFRAVKNILTAPAKFLKSLTASPAEKEAEKKAKEIKAKAAPIPDIGELYKDSSFMFKKYTEGKITKEEFAKYINSVNTKLLNTDTTPTYPQTALASLSRNFVTLITSYFFINDFRNEVLIQSNGENTEKAKEVTNERIAHKLSNFVLNKFFMELFNSTFQKYYLGSLAGATTVAAATELTNESCVRASIGVPIGNRDSREEIEEYEKKHLEQKGIVGAYYRLMARLTGKKMLSEKAEDKK